MRNKQTAYAFFLKHAGYAYGPGQTAKQGQREGAKRLALAERWAVEHLTFEWQEDSEPFEYVCLARDQQTGKVLESLCGISFGPGREPWGEPYRRVVEAELALEASPIA